MNIAQKRDFYAPKDISNDEFEFLYSVIEKEPSDDLKVELHALLRGMQHVSNAKLTLAKLREMTGCDLQQIDAKLHNSLEDLHGEIETSAIESLDSARNGDLRFFNDDEKRLKFAHYFCTQFLRTKRMKQKVEKDVSDWARSMGKSVRFESVWQVMQHIYAAKFAAGLAGQPDQYRLCLLRSGDGYEYVTGDQPLFNIHAVGLKAGEDISALQFYYPVTPKLAIFWGQDVKKENHLSEVCVDEADVSKFNHMIFHESESQVYAACKEALEVLTHEH